MDSDNYKLNSSSSSLPNPLPFFTNLLVSVPNFFSPQAQAQAAGRGRGGLVLGRIGMGVAAAAYVLMVLLAAMIVAAVLGVGLVRSWAEEAVYVRESVQFDYGDAHPTALLTFPHGPAVPPAHTIYVSLSLLMPDSDYNRDIGIFQVSAELISRQGNVIAKSSHPSMLRFKSWPIRYARTFVMGMPLLLGMMSETQRVTFPALKHTEAASPRTHHIRLTLIPRAGTSSLPQFYDAQVVLNSRPPWVKGMVYRWRLTLCVWTTLYIFMMLLMFLVIFLKPLIFPVMGKYKYEEEEEEEEDSSSAEDSACRRGVSESLERWQRSRSKRKAASALQHREGEGEGEAACSSASSMTVVSRSLQEGSADSSESVCC